MSKSVFVKVWLRTAKDDLDLSDAIEFFRYESDVKKGELIEFRLKSDRALDIANNNSMVAGAIMVYQFGFIKNVQSSLRLCRIANIDIDFNDKRIQLSIKAVDKGIEIKKGTSYKIWSNVTLSDMAKQVAANYGLDFIGETTTKKYSAIPQAGRSDWDILNYAMLRESDMYYMTVSDTALYLEKNQRSKSSVRSFKLGENIISVKTQYKEVSQKPQLSQSLLGVNDKTGAPIAKGTATSSELKDGRYSVATISKSPVKKQIGATILRNQDGVKIGERPIYATGNDANESNNLSNNSNEKAKTKVLTANLLIELDPMRKSGEVITLQLPVEKLSGNWYIETARHTIDKSGGFSEFELNKNGTSRPTKTSKDLNDAKVNNTEGSKDSKATVRIYRNAEGNIIKK